MKSVIFASIIASAAAFAPVQQGASKSLALNAEKSPALPFLPYPEHVRGYIGDDIAFDPLGLGSWFPMDYMRESEIKHGRIAMLAAVGFITTDLGITIHPYGQGVSSVAAHDVLAEKGVLGNALVFICLAEIVGYIGLSETLQGSGREPGYFGFGVKYYENKSEAEVKKLKYNEIMNGRLAMLAFGGMVTQSVLYDKGFPYF